MVQGRFVLWIEGQRLFPAGNRLFLISPIHCLKSDVVVRLGQVKK